MPLTIAALSHVIVVTAGAWDCPWARLLGQRERMVVPLVFAANTRSITFVRDGDRFDGQDPSVCGFVAMQGAGAHGGRRAELAGGAVRLDVEGGLGLDRAALDAALARENTETWTGVRVRSGDRTTR